MLNDSTGWKYHIYVIPIIKEQKLKSDLSTKNSLLKRFSIQIKHQTGFLCIARNEDMYARHRPL